MTPQNQTTISIYTFFHTIFLRYVNSRIILPSFRHNFHIHFPFTLWKKLKSVLLSSDLYSSPWLLLSQRSKATCECKPTGLRTFPNSREASFVSCLICFSLWEYRFYSYLYHTRSSSCIWTVLNLYSGFREK